jgi:hypothetical protein
VAADLVVDMLPLILARAEQAVVADLVTMLTILVVEVVVGVLLRTVLPVMQEMVSVDMCLSREFGNRINIRLCHIHYTTPIIQS